MTDEKMLELARHAGFEPDCCSKEWHVRMRKFAALVRREALEEAAKMLDYAADTAFTGNMLVWAEKFARDIRAAMEDDK